jgi:hypothetical protein
LLYIGETITHILAFSNVSSINILLQNAHMP